MHFEIGFIQQLARLGRSDLMACFQHTKQYIDDFCWFNTCKPDMFLDPQQPQVADNRFQIYPLNVVSTLPI